MPKQISDNEIYFMIKYIKSVLWRVAKRLLYIEDARCLKVKWHDLSSRMVGCTQHRVISCGCGHLGMSVSLKICYQRMKCMFCTSILPSLSTVHNTKPDLYRHVTLSCTSLSAVSLCFCQLFFFSFFFFFSPPPKFWAEMLHSWTIFCTFTATTVY